MGRCGLRKSFNADRWMGAAVCIQTNKKNSQHAALRNGATELSPPDALGRIHLKFTGKLNSTEHWAHEESAPIDFKPSFFWDTFGTASTHAMKSKSKPTWDSSVCWWTFRIRQGYDRIRKTLPALHHHRPRDLARRCVDDAIPLHVLAKGRESLIIAWSGHSQRDLGSPTYP